MAKLTQILITAYRTGVSQVVRLLEGHPFILSLCTTDLLFYITPTTYNTSMLKCLLMKLIRKKFEMYIE